MTATLGQNWPRRPDSLGSATKLTEAEMLHRTVADLQRLGMTKLQAWQYQRAIPIAVIARRAKIAPEIARDIFRGEAIPTKDEVTRLAAVLGCEPDDLR